MKAPPDTVASLIRRFYRFESHVQRIQLPGQALISGIVSCRPHLARLQSHPRPRQCCVPTHPLRLTPCCIGFGTDCLTLLWEHSDNSWWFLFNFSSFCMWTEPRPHPRDERRWTQAKEACGSLCGFLIALPPAGHLRRTLSDLRRDDAEYIYLSFCRFCLLPLLRSGLRSQLRIVLRT